MTITLHHHQIGLAAAGAAALGLSLADGLLQPIGCLAERRRALRKPEPAAPPILAETAESLAALPPVEAAPAATTTGHPASTAALPTPEPIDTFAALHRRFGITGAEPQ